MADSSIMLYVVPPHKKTSVPASAGPLLPLTGASRNLPPLDVIAALSSDCCCVVMRTERRHGSVVDY
jgi:hypothetical protein